MYVVYFLKCLYVKWLIYELKFLGINNIKVFFFLQVKSVIFCDDGIFLMYNGVNVKDDFQ